MPLTQLDPTVALVVIDLQKGIVGLNTVHPAAEIVTRAAQLARAFREHNLPVGLGDEARTGGSGGTGAGGGTDGTETDSITRSISVDVFPASTWKLARFISRATPKVKSTR
jgi:hypothetical protein